MKRLEILNLCTLLDTPYATDVQKNKAKEQLPELSAPIINEKTYTSDTLKQLQQNIVNLDSITSIVGTHPGQNTESPRRTKRRRVVETTSTPNLRETPMILTPSSTPRKKRRHIETTPDPLPRTKRRRT